MSPGPWTFEIEETSASVYRVTGRGPSGLRVQRSGLDPDALLEQCKRDAAELSRQAEPDPSAEMKPPR